MFSSMQTSYVLYTNGRNYGITHTLSAWSYLYAWFFENLFGGIQLIRNNFYMYDFHNW